MAKAKTITVKLAELAKQIVVKKVKAGTTVAGFLEENSIDYSSSVRVNGVTTTKGTKLKTGDIITIVGSVTGGKA